MRRSRAAFTLIESMVVVAVLGVLAAIAIPAFVGYLHQAKTSEAMYAVSSMYRLSAAYYIRDYPLVRAVDAPSYTACVVDPEGPVPEVPNSSKQVVAWGDHPSFEALGYARDAPGYYSLEIVSDPGCGHEPGEALYSFRAHGDLDGDGDTSLFEVSAGSSSNNQLMRSPGTYMVDRAE